MGRTIRICSLSALLLALNAPALARPNDATDADLFWAAQRADLSGQSSDALKGYERLLAKLPQSNVAVDRLFETAVLQGNFPAALKAARAQQLADSGSAALPLMFYVDAWKRKDWAEATRASAEIQADIFGFMAPLLNAWTAVAQGEGSGISNGTLRDNGTLAYYSDDQLVYFDLALGRIDSAKSRLKSFPGFGADHARQMALSSVEYLGRNGQGEFANALLDHLGLEPMTFTGKPAKFAPEDALAALFARLSAQLAEQNVPDQALYFARLSQWIAPDSAFARMTLADQLASEDLYPQALALLDGVAPSKPQFSWALGDKARLLSNQGRGDDALKLIQAARAQAPEAADLKLLEAQHLATKDDLAGAESIYRSLIGKADAAPSQNGRRVTYRMLLSQILDSRNDASGSKAVLEEAFAINDQNPQLLNSLGYGLLERREDVKRGLELVTKAHSLAPQSAAITDSLAWGHYLNGDYAKAIPLLESAVETAMDDVAINEHLGDAYWRAGRQIEARYAWRAAALQAKDEAGVRLAAKIDLGWTEATAAP